MNGTIITLFKSLTQACCLENDSFQCRLPIHANLLELTLFKTQRVFSTQPYLETLYKAIFMLMYYGLMRIGEVVTGTHTARAKDVHIAHNKDKILIILCSSKTHGFESQPQKIKIEALGMSNYRS